MIRKYFQLFGLPFLMAIIGVTGVFSLALSSQAQEKTKPVRKADHDRIVALEEAMKDARVREASIADLKQRLTQLELRNTQLEQKLQQSQFDLGNTHQRDVNSLTQQIQQLDQQVRNRRP